MLFHDSTVAWGDCWAYHEGPLCEICADNAYRDPGGTCQTCPEGGLDPVAIYMPIFAILCIIVAALVYSVKKAEKKRKAAKELKAKILAEKEERRTAENVKRKAAGEEELMTVAQEQEEKKKQDMTSFGSLQDKMVKGAGDAVLNIQVAGAAAAQSDALKSLKNLKEGVNVNTLTVIQEDMEDFLQSSFADPENAQCLADGAEQAGGAASAAKIHVGTFSTISAMTPSLGLKFEPGVLKFLNGIGIVSLDVPSLLPIGCVYAVDYYDIVTVMMVWPALISLGLFLLHKKLDADAAKQTDEAKKDVLRHRSATAFKWVTNFLFVVYPSLCKTIFNCFPCDEFNTEDGIIRKLRADYRVDCDSDRYTG